MTEERTLSNPPAGDSGADRRRPAVDWADPSVPAGDAPPMPRWPLIFTAGAYGLWLCFLVAMAVVRYRTTSL